MSHWIEVVLENNTVDSDGTALSISDFSKAKIDGNVLNSRNGDGLNFGYYSQGTADGNTITSWSEAVECWSYSDIEMYNSTITSRQDFGLEIRYHTRGYFEGVDISAGSYGVYVSETTIDLVNSTIDAPNEDDVHLGSASAIRPALIRCLNTTFNQSSTGFDNDDSRLNVSWYASNIWVEWQNERRVPFADIWIEDIHEDVVFTGNANANGEINWLPVQGYTQNRTYRNDYTRHTFSAEMNGVTSYIGANMNQNQNLRIILQDIVNDPEIVILNPVDEGVYNTSVVWVNGTANDPESGIYMVDVWPEGMDAILANGTEDWGSNVTLDDGEWTLTVNATNYAGVKEAVSISITVDTVEPDLTVDFPPVVALVNSTNITVTGLTEPGANVTVNGLVAVVETDGTFSLEISLPEGINTVVVASHDAAMNYNISVHEVTVDITPPPLVVSSPPGDIITTESPLVVAGWVEIGANLTMNGVEIAHDGEPWSVVVTLTEDINILDFTARDAAGNTNTTIRTVIYDTTDPSVNVLYPPEDHLTNETVLNLTGWTEDLTLLLATVNGKNVTVDPDGNFSINISLEEGLNEIEIVVRDEAGHMTIVRRMVTLDTVAPPLDVFRPVDGILTNDPMLHVIGTTELGANVTVNNVDVLLNVDGAFDCTVTMTEGTNEITVVSRDPAGNPTVIVRTVDLDITAPDLKVSSPKKGDSYKEVALEVKGTVSDNVALAKLTINGKEVQVKDGKFSTTVAMKKGSNKVTIVATDTAGNVVTEEIKITRKGLTGVETGLLGAGFVLLIVGLIIGLMLGRGAMGKKPKNVLEDDIEPVERDPTALDEEEPEGPEDEPEEPDEPEEGDGPGDEKAEEDPPAGPPEEEKPPEETRNMEDKKAESEMPPDDTMKTEDKSAETELKGLLKKLDP